MKPCPDCNRTMERVSAIEPDLGWKCFYCKSTWLPVLSPGSCPPNRWVKDIRKKFDDKISDIETLRAWCHWKRRETGVSSDDLEFVQALENVISQVGTWKARFEQMEKERTSLTERVLDLHIEIARLRNQEFKND